MAYTSALYCYPYPIEKIELGRLKSFTERFFELGLTRGESSLYVQLKFGKGPMQDAKATFEVKAVNEYIGVTEDIDWAIVFGNVLAAVPEGQQEISRWCARDERDHRNQTTKEWRPGGGAGNRSRNR